jgi:hypothetical protein
LTDHLRGGRIEVSKDLDGDTSGANQGRNSLDDLLVLLLLFLQGQFVPRGNSTLKIWILSHKRRVRGLPIEKSQEVSDVASLVWIATV